MKAKAENVKFVLFVVATLWVVHVVNWLLPLRLEKFGILPRTLRGLIGIVFSPFLHANLFHLIGNTIPLLVLTLLLVVFYEKIAPAVIGIVVIVGGGNAGMSAVVTEATKGARTVLITKSPFPGGSSIVAGGFHQASFGPDDSVNLHFQDTVKGGYYLNNQKLVRILVSGTKDAILDLEDFGVIQSCLTGPEMGPPAAGCEKTNLDNDDDVDGDDVSIYLGCMTGPNIPGDVDCAN